MKNGRKKKVKGQNRPRNYILFREDGDDAVAVSSRGKNDADVAVQRFRKDLIRVGDYTLPDGSPLKVTGFDLKTWSENFRRMTENGVDVEVTKDHGPDAEDVLGYVKDMIVEDDTLYAVEEIIGARNIEIAETVRNDSVEIDLDATDGQGNKYGSAIVATSIVQKPVVPGQGQRIKIAASRGRGVRSVPVYRLAAPDDEDTTMTPEQLAAIQKALGTDKDITEDNLAEVVGGRVSELTKKHDDLKGLLDDEVGKAKALAEKVADLEGKLGDATPDLDADTAEDRAEDVEARVDDLVKAGRITPDNAKRIKLALIGPADARNVYMLSRVSAADSNGRRRVRGLELVDLIADLAPVPTGEGRTGIQTLSRSTPDHGSTGDGKDTWREEAKRQAEMANASGNDSVVM